MYHVQHWQYLEYGTQQLSNSIRQITPPPSQDLCGSVQYTLGDHTLGKNMNYQIAIVGCLTLLAFVAHIFGGIREALST